MAGDSPEREHRARQPPWRQNRARQPPQRQKRARPPPQRENRARRSRGLKDRVRQSEGARVNKENFRIWTGSAVRPGGGGGLRAGVSCWTAPGPKLCEQTRRTLDRSDRSMSPISTSSRSVGLTALTAYWRWVTRCVATVTEPKAPEPPAQRTPNARKDKPCPKPFGGLGPSWLTAPRS